MCHSVITIPDHTDIRLCHLHHTKLRKRKFIFLNSCQRKGPISTTEEFLNLCQDGTNTSMCLGDYAEQQVHFMAIHGNTWHLMAIHDNTWHFMAIHDNTWHLMASFLCFVDRASLYNLVNKTNLVHNFSCVFISILCMFRATIVILNH